MKTRLRISVVGFFAVSAMCLTPAFGQGRGGGRGGNQAPDGPTPKLANGKPDFSGFWLRPYTPDMSAGAVNMDGKPYPPEDPMQRGVALSQEKIDQCRAAAAAAAAAAPAAPAAAGGGRGAGGRGGGGGRGGNCVPNSKVLPFTPAGAQDWKTYTPDNGDYTGACLPFGLMRSINSPDPLEIVQNQNFFAELFEQNTWFHLVPIDGRPHNKDVPSWFGDSVGHWEGDTLVIETNNFNGRTRLDTNGHPHSDSLVLTERWTRPTQNVINYEMIIHDPKFYTEDWKNVRTFNLRNDQHIMEYSCEENNKALYEGRIKAPKYD